MANGTTAPSRATTSPFLSLFFISGHLLVPLRPKRVLRSWRPSYLRPWRPLALRPRLAAGLPFSTLADRLIGSGWVGPRPDGRTYDERMGFALGPGLRRAPKGRRAR